MHGAVTRELKLALIVGVTLVLAVAVLISDHLAAQRRPKTMTDVATQPVMTPTMTPPSAPAPAPVKVAEPPPSSKVLNPSPTAVAEADKHDEPLARITQATPKVSGLDEKTRGELTREVEQRGGTVQGNEIRLGAKPMLNTAEVPAPGAKTYTVAEGDSAFKIAKQQMGDGKHWKELIDANPGAFGAQGQVKVGTKLNIPMLAKAPLKNELMGPPARGEFKPGDSETVTASLRGKSKFTQEPDAPGKAARKDDAKAEKTRVATYTVKRGDTLSEIARRELGSVGRATEIADLNRSVIKDPDNLIPGLAIKLP